ncbi:MAG: cytochrome b [Variibacter sp.]|nr:cytochrome b [Variibacter sp.]
MTYGTQPGGYSGIAKTLHWLVAASVLTTIPVAITMVRLDSGPMQDRLYNLHKSLGVLIFVLMALRLLYRLSAGAPAPEPTLNRMERAASSAVHGLLYVLLLAMPIVGYLANSAYGAPTPFFGLFNLPPLVAENEKLSEWLFALHRWTGFTVGALAAAHIAAALQHFVIRRDGVLQRMLPRALGGV